MDTNISIIKDSYICHLDPYLTLTPKICHADAGAKYSCFSDNFFDKDLGLDVMV